MKRKLFTLLLVIAASVGTLYAATKVRIDKLYYALDEIKMTATVSCDLINSSNNYRGLTTAYIPSTVTYGGKTYTVTGIGDQAFNQCTSLTSVTIPYTVTSIGDYAFMSCYNLSPVKIPHSVTSIGYCAFNGCAKMMESPIYNEHCFAHLPSSYTTYTIPDGIEQISGSAFMFCSNLTSVKIPNSVTNIGKFAFYQCEKLISIEIPSSVTSVEVGAFQDCKKLKELRYPEGLDLSNAKVPSSTKLIAYASNYAPKTSPSQPTTTPQNPTQLPLLALVEGSVRFSDITKNNQIDGNEYCEVSFEIQNNGKGAAQNCEARVRMSGNTAGITTKNIKLPTIAVGKTYKVTIPVTSTINTQDGKVTLSIEVYEPNGFGVTPFNLSVATKAYDPPLLQVVDYNIASNSGKIRKMEPFTLTFNLQNTKYGDAESVKVNVILPANIFPIDGVTEFSYPKIQSGEVVNVSVPLIANNNYSTDQIPITIDIKEKHGNYAENKNLNIAMNQTAQSMTINIASNEQQQERKEIQLAMMTSEVDRNIPVSKTKNPNTFVLIIANEHYQQVASVPFALNDGNIFREYCIKTLGIGEKHIHYVADATGNQIKSHINWLANITETWDDAQIIVYYAGHGIPDEASKSAYLLPVDGSGTDVTTGYKLDDLYATLGNMPASQITVFMDACFSGSKREQGMLASARGVALKAKSGVPQGKMVVFSAAQGDETAYSNREQQHGLFTYYLLKKLQETQGDIALKDLGDYVTKQVSQQSLLINSKKQTPCVTPSASIGTEWQNWKLK